MRVRCLHCHEPVELSDESDFSSLTCPSCGSEFSLVGERTVTHRSAQVRTVGHFDLIDQVGIGAFGSVWKARDTELDRTVAVKIPRKGELDAEEAELFLREARAAAQLRHPNIVGVHEVGRDDDSIYIVSDYVDGVTLDDWLTGQQPTVREAAELCAKIAEALHHAHESGVIHRDLKPGNIMLDLDGEPHLMDFGLARRTAGEATMTVEGRILGTPAYMSPEQARGEGHGADRRTDIYSAGVVLFKLLTGELPFRGNLQMLVVQIQREEAPSPRKLNGRIPRDLETICLKCLEKSPERRYATAAELAAELRRWLNGQPIKARPIGSAARSWRWCHRNPLPASLVAGIVLVFLVGFAAVFWQWRRVEAARLDEQAQRKEAVLARDEATAQGAKAGAEKERAEREMVKAQAAEEQTAAALYSSNIVRARLQYLADNIADAETILDRCAVNRRGWEWHFLKKLCHADLLTLRGHTGWVQAVAYSPDGKLLATAGGGNPFWASQGAASIRPGEVMLWDAATGARLRTLLGHKNVVTSVAFSPDGMQLATGSQDDTVRLWEAASGKLLRVLPGRSPPLLHRRYGVDSLAFSPDGELLAAGMYERIDVWDLTVHAEGPPAPRSTLPGPRGQQAAGVVFGPDSRRLAAAYRADWEGGVQVYDLADGDETLELEANGGIMNGVAWSADGRYLAAWHRAGVKFWDAATGEILQSLEGRDFDAGAFSPTGTTFAAGSTDGAVRLYSAPEGEEVRRSRGHRNAVLGVAFGAGGQRLASASADGTVKVWDVTQDPEHGLLDSGPLQVIDAIAFADQGRRLVAAMRGGEVYAQDGDTSPQWRPWPTVAMSKRWLAPAEPACLDAEGRWLAGISQQDPKVAKCWEAASGRERATFNGHQQDLWFVTINPGGGRVATAGRAAGSEPRHSEVKVWDATDGRALFQIDEPNFLVTRLALNPAGDHLAVAGVRISAREIEQQPLIEPILLVYHVDSAKVTRAFTPPSLPAGEYEPLYALAFSADGTRLAAAGSARTVLLWDLSAEQPIVTSQGPEGAMDLAFSPNGRRLAVASRHQIKLLDSASGEEVLTLLGRKHLLPDANGFNPRVRFSPDGQRLMAICHGRLFPLALWSVEDEADRNPEARLRAAARRATARHLAFATTYAGDPEKRAEFLFHLKQLQGLELTTAHEYVARGAVYARAGQADEAEADFARAFELAPQDPMLLKQAGEGFAFAGLWDQAAPYFDQYYALGEGDFLTFSKIAALPLYRNDRATYRRYVDLLLERYEQSADPEVLLTVLVWGLLVSGDDVDPHVLVRMADRCLEGNQGGTSYKYAVRAKGMAEYRAGHLESAVEWLRKADSLGVNKAPTHFFLSMAYHRLNRADEAQAALQVAMRDLTAYFGSSERYIPGKLDWYSWPLQQVLRREAEALLNGAKDPDKPQD